MDFQFIEQYFLERFYKKQIERIFFKTKNGKKKRETGYKESGYELKTLTKNHQDAVKQKNANHLKTKKGKKPFVFF